MNYKKEIESYYEDRLNKNILANTDDKELGRLLRESPEIIGILIANNVYTRNMFLEIDKYNATYVNKRLLIIARTIIYNKYLKELYNYVVINPYLLSYYFNRRNDPCWLIKLYKELQLEIIDAVANDNC